MFYPDAVERINCPVMSFVRVEYAISGHLKSRLLHGYCRGSNASRAASPI